VSFTINISIQNFYLKGKNGAIGYDGGDGLIIENSSVNLENLKVEGGMGGQVTYPTPQIPEYFKGGIGIRCYNSTLNISNSQVFGGNGINGLHNMGWDYNQNDYGDGGIGSEGIQSADSDILIGDCHIQGGKGGIGGYGGDGTSTGEWMGKKGGDGGNGDDALSIDFINITIINSTVVGGSGGNGGNGGSSYYTGAQDGGGFGGLGGISGKGIFSEKSNLSIENADIYGGIGGNGGTGGLGHRWGGNGGNGEQGGDGFSLLDSIVLFSNGTITSGNGGHGGKGGTNGGSGGEGKNSGSGIVGIQSYIELYNISIVTLNGGDGGNTGGNGNDGRGGYGGNGGFGIYSEFSNFTLDKISINTGNGGLGGYGGYTTYTSPASGIRNWGGDGGKGGNGGDSIFIINSNLTVKDIDSSSGDGRNGGYGGDAVEYLGGNGGNGGNGGSTIISDSSTLYLINGDMTGGNAGNGLYGGETGNASNSVGGDGGKGGDGGRLFFNNTKARLENVNITTGNGGDGGDGGKAGLDLVGFPPATGGDGGDGGIGGDGIYTINSNVTFENSSIVCGYGGIGGSNGAGYIPGTPGSNGRNGTMYIDPSHITFLNSYINGGDSDNPLIIDSQSKIEFKWYLHVGVKNSTGIPVRNADVIVKDNINGTFEENHITGFDGYARWIITTEYIETQSGKIYYTPHNISTIFNGNISYVVPEPQMNQSIEVVTTFNELIDYLLLDYGWNLISIPRFYSDNSIQSVFQSLTDEYVAMQFFDSLDSNDPWKHYHTSKSSNLNDLNLIDPDIGLWIYISVPGGTTFVLNGVAPSSPQSISLFSGWNLVGYPSLTSHNRTVGLNNLDFGIEVDTIQRFNSSTKTWHNMDKDDSFEIGIGYWVHAKFDCIWEVPL
jgi:hypothetical protein